MLISRKDQCKTCIGYKHRSIDELTYQRHLERKDDARIQKLCSASDARPEERFAVS